MNSNISLKLYNLIKTGVIKSNAQFWKSFYNEDYINTFPCDLQTIKQEFEEKSINVISVFDENFPNTNVKLKNSERPFFFAYRGDITLLNNLDKNVAVIGVLTPTNEILDREKKVVNCLIQKDYNIVSGLAKGCDTVAHSESVKRFIERDRLQALFSKAVVLIASCRCFCHSAKSFLPFSELQYSMIEE